MSPRASSGPRMGARELAAPDTVTTTSRRGRGIARAGNAHTPTAHAAAGHTSALRLYFLFFIKCVYNFANVSNFVCHGRFVLTSKHTDRVAQWIAH